jgi:hypothetical protein
VGGVKVFISIAALAGTLLGWGLIGESQVPSSAARASEVSRSITSEPFFGPLPTLVPGNRSTFSQGGSDGSGASGNLRTVNPPPAGSSRPVPVTRTQSSR